MSQPAPIPGLGAAVELWRDQWGIPHVRAASMADVFAGLGFAHAQDRLWQMEALFRRGTGRYAEWLGPRALPGDRLARQVDTVGASKRDLEILGADARTMLEAYARGVNAFIALRQWPVEYQLLGAEPEAWEPWKSIAVMRQIGFLMGSVWWKLWRAAALPILGWEGASKLRFDDGGDDLLCIPQGAEGGRLAAALADLETSIKALLDDAGAEIAGGSNNWALSAPHTASGRPLVAGDPHRVLEMPNMYAQAHIACDQFDAIGLTIPGVPGFPHFGHSAGVAWCVTHAFVDIHDLYVERFDAGGSRYLFKGEWLPAKTRDEVIQVRGGAAETVRVTETGHGPVIVGDPAKGKALALRSTQFAVPDRSFDCLVPMLRARTVEGLYEATRGWGLIDHNLVAGDTQGKIGHRVRALVPRRSRSNGWLPVPGWTGEHEWDGMVPFEEMPAQIDPAGGRIVTANNRVVPPSFDPYMSTDSMPPHRARRIWKRLEALGKATVEDMASIHRDRVSLPGLELQERCRAIPAPAGAEALHAELLAWDGEMTGASRGAVIYTAVRTQLTRLVIQRSGLDGTAASDCTKVAPGIIPENQFWWTLPQFLRANDTSILGGASWEQVLAEAMQTAAASLPDGLWSQLHTPALKHPLSADFPDQAAALDARCAPLSGDGDTPFASNYALKAGWQASSSSLARYVFDVGAWENCRWVVFHGASGVPGSPHHTDQNVTWAAGELLPMLYDWREIERRASSLQTLAPKP